MCVCVCVCVCVQAESMLPTHLGDTMRTVRDETFFELRPLRQRVLPIGRYESSLTTSSLLTRTCTYVYSD